MAPVAIDTFEHYAPVVFNKTPVTKCNYGQTNGAKNSKKLVRDALKDHIRGIDSNECEPGEDDAFFVCDMGEIYRQILRWKMNLKRAKPHYGQ